MEILTPKATRRSTRLRVEIPITVTSLDRMHPFAEKCVALVVSAQGCGFRSPQALPLETPVLLGELPGGGSASGYVASCLPLGADAKSFLIGVALYNHGNVWGIANPPEDWDCGSEDKASAAHPVHRPPVVVGGNNWPYNMFSGHTEAPCKTKLEPSSESRLKAGRPR
jgi:hypothetical protein